MHPFDFRSLAFYLRSSRTPLQNRLAHAVRAWIEALESRTLLTSVVVNTTSDTTTAAGLVTLSDAIEIATSSADPTAITFDPTVFATPQTITLNGSPLELDNSTEPTTITGSSAGVTISGNSATQGFLIDSGTVTLSNLTVVQCNAEVGAAISNDGNLTLKDCTLSDNDATSNDDGGGIANYATATLINDTLANNTGDGLDERGGAATLINCTISGNYSYAPYSGAGIYLQDSGTVTIGNSIVAGNSAATGGQDVWGAFNSLGHNLIGTTDGSTGWVSSDLTGTLASPLSPDLGSLTDNGGPSQSMLPLSGSPALDAGSLALIPAGITTDQRGAARTANGTVDVGAVESETNVVVNIPPENIGGLNFSFGTDGLASHDVGFAQTDGLVQDGGQSIIVGAIGTAPDESFGVTRYNADGTLDTTFGAAGTASTSFGGTDDLPGAAAVLPTGLILEAGTATAYTNGVASGSEFAVAEFNSNGSLDTSFGNGTGQILVSFSASAPPLSNDLLNAMTVSPSGVIYLAGSSDAAGAGATDFAIAALNPSGSLDTAFGSDGKVLASFGAGDDAANALKLQSNGDVVAAGSATIDGVTRIALARFLPGGLLDKHFGNKGEVPTSVGGVYDSASSLLILPHGQILIGGVTASGSGSSLTSNFVLVQYTSGGAIDRSFGGGPVVTSFGQPSAVTRVLLQANGDIIASGKTTAGLANVVPSALELAVARYTAKGVLDTTFNSTGKAIIDLNDDASATSSSQITSLAQFAVQPLDASSLGTQFAEFVASKQGVISMTPGGAILDAGNSGADTVVAEIITTGVELATTLLSQLPPSVTGGAKASAIVQITEDGTQTATGTVSIELETSTTAQGIGATAISTVPQRIGLRRQQSRSYRIQFVYPQNLTAGDYYLLAVVNNGSSAALMDLNPAIEQSSSKTAIDIAPPFISLAGSALSAASTFTVGKTATVDFTITNNGNVAAKGTTTTALLLSTDQVAADGVTIANIKLAVNLSSGRSRAYRVSYKLPSTVTTGMYYLIAEIDPLDDLGTIDQTSSTILDAAEVTVG